MSIGVNPSIPGRLRALNKFHERTLFPSRIGIDDREYRCWPEADAGLLLKDVSDLLERKLGSRAGSMKNGLDVLIYMATDMLPLLHVGIRGFAGKVGSGPLMVVLVSWASYLLVLVRTKNVISQRSSRYPSKFGSNPTKSVGLVVAFATEFLVSQPPFSVHSGIDARRSPFWRSSVSYHSEVTDIARLIKLTVNT